MPSDFTQVRKVDLLCAEQRRRWQAGDRVRAEALLAESPELHSDGECLLELLYNEMLVREELGETPQLDEYVRAYPDLADRLKTLFEVHLVLESGDSLDVHASGPSRPTLPQEGAAATENHVFVAGYELLDEVGRGGMGVVYRARQIGLDRAVAVKMILAGEWATPAELRRFRTEAEAAAQLDHPNIVPIYEVGEHQGRPFFSMKLIEGDSLTAARGAAGDRAPSREAAQLVATVARAVHHAHQHGILHRDLKPANVLRDRDGQPYVTDFGLAKRLPGGPNGSAGAGQTHAGAIVGTPSYMAPEQAAGRRTLTTAIDVYGLGAILYELLAGQPPFRGESVLSTLNQVREREPTPPRQVRAGVAPDLETICLKCLEKTPERRYATAGDLAGDLRRFLAGEPILARRTTPVERLFKWVRRRPANAALALLTALTALLGLAGVLWQWHAAETARKQALQKGEEAERSAERVREILRNDERLQAIHRPEYVEHFARAVRDPRKVFRDWSPEDVRRPQRELLRCPSSFRNWEWHYLWRQNDPVRYSSASTGVLLTALAASPDGLHVAVGADTGAVALWRGDRRERVWESRGHEHGIVSLMFSPDGQQIVSGGADGKLLLWDLADGAKPLVRAGHTGPITRVAYHPAGGRVLSVSRDGSARFWESATGKEEGLPVQARYPLLTAAWHPHRAQFATDGPDGNVTLWNAVTRAPLATLPGLRGAIENVAFSPDGTLLAAGGEDGAVRMWRIEDREVVFTGKHTQRIASLAFSPCGKHLLATNVSEHLRVWNVRAAEQPTHLSGIGSHVAFLPTEAGPRLVSITAEEMRWWYIPFPGPAPLRLAHAAPVTQVAFAYDRARLAAACADGTVGLWNAATGNLEHRLAVPGQAIHAVAFSADRRHLALAGKEGWIQVWDAVGKKQRFTCPGHTGAITSLAFGQEGKWLASAGEDGTVRIWEMTTGQQEHTLRGHTSAVIGVAAPFRGDQLVSCDGDGEVILWDLKNLTQPERYHLRGDRAAPVRSMAVSLDGRFVALGKADGSITLRDATSSARLTTWLGHHAEVQALCFSPDSRRLVSVGKDEKVRLWDVFIPEKDGGAREPLLTLDHPRQHPRGTLTSVAFSPQGGHYLAIADDAGDVLLWDGRPQ